MQRIPEAAHSRMAVKPRQRPGVQTPAAFLSLAQIVNLAEKRLRWYGFADWQIHDVICNHNHTVAIQVRGRNEVVATLTFARDCGVVHYGIHVPGAVRLAPVFAAHASAGAAAAPRGNAKKPRIAERRKEFPFAEQKRRALKAVSNKSENAPDKDPSALDMPLDYNERAFGRGRAMLNSLAENR